MFNAISFPDKQYVKDLIKKKGLLKVVKKELDEKLEAKPCSCNNIEIEGNEIIEKC